MADMVKISAKLLSLRYLDLSHSSESIDLADAPARAAFFGSTFSSLHHLEVLMLQGCKANWVSCELFDALTTFCRSQLRVIGVAADLSEVSSKATPPRDVSKVAGGSATYEVLDASFSRFIEQCTQLSYVDISGRETMVTVGEPDENLTSASLSFAQQAELKHKISWSCILELQSKFCGVAASGTNSISDDDGVVRRNALSIKTAERGREFSRVFKNNSWKWRSR
jgi:hypothetical protein